MKKRKWKFKRTIKTINEEINKKEKRIKKEMNGVEIEERKERNNRKRLKEEKR